MAASGPDEWLDLAENGSASSFLWGQLFGVSNLDIFSNFRHPAQEKNASAATGERGRRLAVQRRGICFPPEFSPCRRGFPPPFQKDARGRLTEGSKKKKAAVMESADGRWSPCVGFRRPRDSGEEQRLARLRQLISSTSVKCHFANVGTSPGRVPERISKDKQMSHSFAIQLKRRTVPRAYIDIDQSVHPRMHLTAKKKKGERKEVLAVSKSTGTEQSAASPLPLNGLSVPQSRRFRCRHPSIHPSLPSSTHPSIH